MVRIIYKAFQAYKVEFKILVKTFYTRITVDMKKIKVI